MLLITVTSVGILSIFFYTSVWPLIRNNMDSKTKCTKAICEEALAGGDHPNQVKCTYKNGNENMTIYCPYKG